MKTALLILTIGFLGTAFAADEMKLGFIDMQKAIQETAAGKKAKKDLEQKEKRTREKRS